MLELTVKTLDSQNHSFTLCDEATVLNLKESILEKMEVPIASQRLIFHGKVLQDQKKLTEYGDVNGKVIHLVQRAPPSATSRPNDGPSSRATDNNGSSSRRFMRREGNATYLGSMTFPAFSSFSPGIIDNGLELPTRPSQMMARNRIDCAKRMMGYARSSIQYMANPNSQPHSSPSGRHRRQQPFAVVIPNGSSSDETGAPTDAASSATDNPLNPQDNISPAAAASAIAAAMNAVQGVHVPAIAVIRGSSTSDGQVELSIASDDLNFDEPHQDVAVEVEIESTDANGEGRSDVEVNVRDNSVENRAATRPEEGVRVDAMVPLLSELETLNTDLQPFLARCRDLLSADNSFDDNSSPSYQEAVRVFGGVSETLHSISHACHALSDLMVDFDEDAPRSLRCRPVVLQHSTILEAGVPLRLIPHETEGQISVSRLHVIGNGAANADATASPAAQDAVPPPPAASATSTSDTSSDSTQSSSSASSDVNGSGSGFTSVQVGPFHMNGPDGIPGDLEIFMDFGLEPNFISTSSSAPTRDSATTATTSNTTPTNTTTTSATPGAIPSPGIHINTFPGLPTILSGPFMGGSGQINLQPAVDAIAGHFRNQLIGAIHAPDISFNMRSDSRPATAGASPVTGNVTVSPATSSSDGQSQAATPKPATEPSGTSSNSSSETGAARTRLNATTTTTRGTTAAPEQAAAGSQTTPTRRMGHPPGMIDMLQSIFQGSFDPALPCNSHHIRPIRHRPPQQRVRVDYLPRPPSPQVVARSLGGRIVTVSVPNRPPVPTTGLRRGSLPSIMEQLATVSRELQRTRGGPSDDNPIAEFVNNLSEQMDGRSVFADLLGIMTRNVGWTEISELLDIPFGRIDSILQRIHPVLHGFAVQRILQGETITRGSLMRACDRFSAEMRPVLDALHLTRQSVDLPATIRMFNRTQLHSILVLMIGPSFNSFGTTLADNLTRYLRALCNIIRYCCVDNDNTFDSVVRDCLRQVTQSIPVNLEPWVEQRLLDNYHFYLVNLPQTDISHYIVFRMPGTTLSETSSSTPASVEPMETDGATAENPDEAPAEPLVAMETENVPEVVLGTEQWHNTLPSDWVPIMARDAQRQRKQNSQKPFSDAYLSGMPPKRRKIIAASKPPAESLSQTITEGVRQAIEAAGVSSPLADQAVAEAGRDSNLQEAYKEQEKKSAGPKIKDDPDFKSGRFPHAHPFFE